MNYRRIYLKIVFNAKKEMENGKRPSSKPEKKYFEQVFELHHILPKSLYPLWEDRKSNIVPLTPREHFFCHQLLTKIYPCKQMYFAVAAFVKRPNNDYGITSREYQRLKEDLIKNHCYRKWPEEEKKVFGEKMKEIWATPEGREKFLKNRSHKIKHPCLWQKDKNDPRYKEWVAKLNSQEVKEKLKKGGKKTSEYLRDKNSEIYKKWKAARETKKVKEKFQKSGKKLALYMKGHQEVFEEAQRKARESCWVKSNVLREERSNRIYTWICEGNLVYSNNFNSTCPVCGKKHKDFSAKKDKVSKEYFSFENTVIALRKKFSNLPPFKNKEALRCALLYLKDHLLETTSFSFLNENFGEQNWEEEFQFLFNTNFKNFNFQKFENFFKISKDSISFDLRDKTSQKLPNVIYSFKNMEDFKKYGI